MLHPTRQTGPSTRTSRVHCRARTWHVLDERTTPTGAWWRLAQSSETPRLIASPPDDIVPLTESLRRRSRHVWAARVGALAATAAPFWWPTESRRLPVTPHPWQLVPAITMLSGHHRRLLVADDVGAGKTIEAGVLLREVHGRDADAATLVVAPAALVAQWRDELRARLAMDVRVLDAEAFRREAGSTSQVVDASRTGNCWLLSMDLLRQPDVARLVARTPWTLLVLDEAHHAVPDSARLSAVSGLADVSVRVLLLTGTPTAGGTAGADALRQLGARHGERPMPVLRRARQPTAPRHRHTCTLSVDLGAAHLDLCAQLSRFADRASHERGADGLLPALVLRRRAASCPDALRRSIARRLENMQPLRIPLQPPLFAAADSTETDLLDDVLLQTPAWRDGAAERRELQRLHDLAAALPSAGRKGDAVARFVRRCREPVVVFTAYLDTLRALRPQLAGSRIVIVHGQQPEALRRAAVNAFTAGEADVLLTTDACAEGLNLHACCRTVIHAEVPASARIFRQRNGRVDRHGQCRRVHTIVLASDTVEDARAMTRLRERDEAAEAWMARVCSTGCRRTRLATRLAAAGWSPRPLGSRHALRRHPVQAVTETTRASPAGPILLRLTPPRWRRLCRRIDADTAGERLWVGRLHMSSGVGLAEMSAPLAVITTDGASPPTEWSSADWQRIVPAQWQRAERLARRLARWDADARVAVAVRVRTDLPAPSLFEGGGEAPAVPAPAGRSSLVGRFEVIAIVERRR